MGAGIGEAHRDGGTSVDSSDLRPERFMRSGLCYDFFV